VNDESVAMEVDTEAAASIMSEETFLRIWPKSDVLKTLETYNGESFHFK